MLSLLRAACLKLLFFFSFDVCWNVLHCDNCRIRNQIDATYYFIVLLIGSTCFGHYYAHQQELMTIMLITTLVVSFCKDGGGLVADIERGKEAECV